MRDGSSKGKYATAVVIDDVCKHWPECGCDIDCADAKPFEALPKFRFVEKILLGSIVLGAVACLWLAFT